VLLDRTCSPFVEGVEVTLGIVVHEMLHQFSEPFDRLLSGTAG